MDLFITRNSHRFLCWFLALIAHLPNTIGFDSANSCSSIGKFARQSRAQILNTIPCDLTTQAYCNVPGSAYPWNAVRRFVHENQGLMKRMYGDVRHITILRDEIQDNEIHVEDLMITNDWYTRDRSERSIKLKSKTELFGSRSKDALPKPQFPSATVQTSPSILIKSETKQELPSPLEHLGEDDSLEMSTRLPLNGLGREGSSASGEIISDNLKSTVPPSSSPPPVQEEAEIKSNSTTIIQRSKDSPISQTTPSNDKKLDEYKSSANDTNEEASSSTQTIVFVGDNIQIVESPRLGLNNISVTTSNPREIAIVTTSAPISESTELELDGNLLIHSNTSSEEISPQDFHQKITQNSKPIVEISQQSSVSVEAAEIENVFSENLAKRSETSPEQPSSITTTKPITPVEHPVKEETKKESPPVFNTRGINACPVKEEVVAPFWANNTRGEILALLNLYPFEQYVHWEKCSFEYKQMYCRDGCRCEQQYRLHRLLAYDPHNECRGIFSDWFRFPSCCICKCYDFSYDFTAVSRNAKVEKEFQYDYHFKAAEENVRNAIYDHATEDWYRPRDDFDLNGG